MTVITTHLNASRVNDFILSAVIRTAIMAGISMAIVVLWLYALFFMNENKVPGIRKAKEPGITGNALRGDIDKACFIVKRIFFQKTSIQVLLNCNSLWNIYV